jgi:hypothetical protein
MASGIMRLAGYVEYASVDKCMIILVRKHKGNGEFGKLRHKCEDNIKWLICIAVGPKGRL